MSRNARPSIDYVVDDPRITYAQPSDSWLRRRLITSTEVLFGRRRVEQIYRDLKSREFDAGQFFGDALAAGGVRVNWHGAGLDDVPSTGPLVVLANHPFGVIDGLVLCDLAMRLRGNFRVMINAALCQDRDLAPYFLPIDFADTRQAVRTNLASKKLARDALAAGIPVLIFPAGGVSTATRRFGFGPVEELPWSTFVARLIRDSRAAVLPLHFHGRNSRKFHVASSIAEFLRMALLLAEVRNKLDTDIHVTVGELLPFEALQRLGGRRELTDFLYRAVMGLHDPSLPPRQNRSWRRFKPRGRIDSFRY
ncbi:MAG: lysophospholipid acyltransferase family protein [Pseudomonadota bacterium]